MNDLRFRLRSLTPALLLAVSILSPPFASCLPSAIPDLDLGFIAARDESPDGATRTRALGPFFERQSLTNGSSFTAVRPFYFRDDNEPAGRSQDDFLWPVGITVDRENDSMWRFLNVFHHNFDKSSTNGRSRLLVFPILFSGTDSNGEDYFALFPAGGTIKEFFWMDRIDFALWPLYTRLQINESVTHDILWPVFSYTSGGKDFRWRVFPLYGHSERKDQWEKDFVLWPIWTSARYHYPGASGSSFILFPLFGHTKLTDQESWYVLPPLFHYASNTNGHVSCNAPWPFFQYSSGDVNQFYIWPVYGTKSEHGASSGFVLWPIGTWHTSDRITHDLSRITVFPFYFSETYTPKAIPLKTSQPVPDASLTKVWPLGSYRRDGDRSELRYLDLWPTSGMRSLDRGVSPFWTIGTHTRTPAVSDDDLLWGLYRHRSVTNGSWYTSVFPLFSCGRETGEEGGSRWSFLCGLAGYRRNGNETKWRFLYLFTLRSGGEAKSK